MNTNIRSKGFDLSKGLKEYILTSIVIFEKYNFNVHHFDIIIIDNINNHNSKFEIEYLIKIDYKKENIVVKNQDKDFYKCIDKLNEKTNRVLQKLHKKKVEIKRVLKNNEEEILMLE